MAIVTRGADRRDGNGPSANPGDSAGDGGSVSPAAVATAAGTGAGTIAISGDQPRRRGRPPGSGNRAGTKEPVRARPIDVSSLESVLLSIHACAAAITQCPELGTSPEESRALADGLAKVARHYEWLGGVSQKYVDIGNLAMIAGGIYGAKFMLIRMRLQAGQQPPRGQVVEFPQRQHAATPPPRPAGLTLMPAEVANGPVGDPRNAAIDETHAAIFPGGASAGIDDERTM